MTCTSCGTEILAGAKFCHACGTPVQAACVSCGSPLRPEFRFCPVCGTAVAAAAIGKRETPAVSTESDPSGPTSDRLGRLTRHIPQDLARKIRDIQGTIAGERKLVTVLFCDLVGST